MPRGKRLASVGSVFRALLRQPKPIVRVGALPPLPRPPEEEPDVSIVIVHRKTPWELMQCLEGIERGHAGLQVETILVDQHSTDDTIPTVRRRFLWVQVLDDPTDRGYAASNNLGLARARGHYLLLFNADVMLPSTALAELVTWMDAHPRAGFVGPRLVLPDGSLDLACRRSFPTPIVSLYRLSGLSRLFPNRRTFGRYNLTYLPEEQSTPVDSVMGACMLVRRAAATMVGLLDETYFMYGEDLDWAYRIKEAGWEGWYLASTTALHYKRSSSKRRPLRTTYEFYRAMIIFYRRHYAASAPPAVTWLVLTGILWRGGVAVLIAWLRTRAARRVVSTGA